MRGETSVFRAMQDPTAAAFQAVVTAPPFSAEEQNLRCPRCDSTNTKFCYYNNYNLSQPRHFCKSCRRYWTKGGALRNIPVGGGSRKNSKRAASASASTTKRPNTAAAAAATSSSSPAAPAPPLQVSKMDSFSAIYPPPPDVDRRMLDITGSFTSLLATNGHFVNLLEGFPGGLPGAAGGGLASNPSLSRPMVSIPTPELHSPSNGSESSGNALSAPPPLPPGNFLCLQGDSGCWSGGGSGWPDLAIYTSGSSFQ